MRHSVFIVSMVSLSFTLGFIRDMLVAWQYGGGEFADILYVALIAPVFFENILGVAIRDALIPYLLGLKSRGSKIIIDAVRRLQISAWTIAIFVTVFVFLGAQVILEKIMPGWGWDKVDASLFSFRLAALLIALQTIIYFQTAVLNINGNFILPMWRTILLNLGAIWGIYLSPHNVSWVILGMLLGQFFLLCIQQTKISSFKFQEKTKNIEGVKSLKQLMVPLLIGTTAQQVCFVVERILASFLHEGAIAELTFAFRIATIPLTLFALSIMAVLYVSFSDIDTKIKKESFNYILNKSINMSLVFLVPPAVLMVAIPTSIISILLERGAFTSSSTIAISPILLVYGLGLPGMGLSLLGGRILLAQGRGRLFMGISILCALLIIFLDLISYNSIGLLGLAISYSVCCWIQAILSFLFINRFNLSLMVWITFARWIISSSISYAFFCFLPPPENLVELLVICCVSLVMHLICLRLFGDRHIFSRQFWSIDNIKNISGRSN
jgi:putative peptidoglycan lipid II flippase